MLLLPTRANCLAELQPMCKEYPIISYEIIKYRVRSVDIKCENVSY